MTSTTDDPTIVRELDSPAARALAELAAIFDDLRTVLRCCERLVTELAKPESEADELEVEALWTTVVLAYSRCFSTGREGVELTEEDLASTQLQGAITEWHQVLGQLRDHYAQSATNPRERFSVGAAQDEQGHVSGIAITSARQPLLDDRTVRQTGALAYELSRLVDERITERQERVRIGANSLSAEELAQLPEIDVTASAESDASGDDSSTGG